MYHGKKLTATNESSYIKRHTCLSVRISILSVCLSIVQDNTHERVVPPSLGLSPKHRT